MSERPLTQHYARRNARTWRAALRRFLEPPEPCIRNPREPLHFPLGRWNLYVGGAGVVVSGYVNIDLFAVPGVDTAADAEHLPFPDAFFQCIECDAVLEHVKRPERVMEELTRVLKPGGYLHVVTPFCHPFHQFPSDYRRYNPEGLRQLAPPELETIAEGWRTGPTATFLVFLLEYVKLWLPFRPWRAIVHFTLGWLLFPLRYLDLIFFRSPRAGIVGNHCYVWFRKTPV